MKHEPLFLRVVNNRAGVVDACKAFSSSKHPETAKVASAVLNKEEPYKYDFETFRGDFQECLLDLIDNGITPQVKSYLDSYMAPALEEDVEEESYSQKGATRRSVHIKDGEQPWAEALVCYNLCLFISTGELSQLKKCKKCGRFFTGRGKYAAYCGDACKLGKESPQ